MKIFVIENNCQDAQNISNPLFSVRPETCLLRNNDPFFFPNYTQEIVCKPSFVVRVSKIGKCISQKFANRYYDEIGAGICFEAADLLKRLSVQNAPVDIAKCFDFSAPVGNQFMKIDELDLKKSQLKLEIDNTTQKTSDISGLVFEIDKIVSYLSIFVRFKIGDLIFINPAIENLQIKIGNDIKVSINDELLLNFTIK